MRRAFVIAAALVAAACQVDVEGASCKTPGARTECPDGQACGNDNRCSERAAACGATWCLVGNTRCVSGSNSLESCERSPDPVCGSWQTTECATTTTCTGISASSAVCQCNANGGIEFAADPSGSRTTDAAKPTGIASPPQCRFKHLGDAIAAAGAHGGATTVKAYGGGTQVLFQGETFPLVVPPDVTVQGADAPGVDTAILGDPANAATMIALQGTLQGVHLASATGNGVDTSCGATGTPTLRDVTVTGAQGLAKGISITGSCGALLERVDVAGASVTALEVNVPASATVIVRGSRFHGSTRGVDAVGGKLSFRPDSATPSLSTQVTDNTGQGMVFSGTATIEAELLSVVVARNGGTGLYVNQIPVTSKLTMTSCDIYSNGTIAPLLYGPANGIRSAGGILLTQSGLAGFQFQANRIFGNGGGTGADDLAFYSTWTWPVSTGTCDTTTNTFGCTGGGPSSSGATISITPGGTVGATRSNWATIPPSTNGSVVWDPDCGGAAPACPP